MPDAKYCPREPTREMVAAGWGVHKDVETLWRAMFDAAPAQAEPRDDHSLDYIADEYAAPSPAAEDGLVAALRAYKQADDEGVMVLVSRQACDEAAARIECDAQEIAGLRTLIESATRDKRLDGKTLLDFVYVWRDQAEDRARKAEAERDAALRRAEALHTAVQSFRCGCALASELRSGCLASPAETKGDDRG